MKNTIYALILLVGLSTLCSCTEGSSAEKQSTDPARVVDITVVQFDSLKSAAPGIILDVRTPGEVAEGVVAEAVVMDITQSDFMDKVSQLEKGKPIYVYCKAGGRSSNASQKLIDLGYTNVYNVMGGMDAWKGAGYPTSK